MSATSDTQTTFSLKAPVPIVNFMGLPLARLTVDNFMHWMIARAIEHRDNAASEFRFPIFVTYLNAWCSIIAERDPEYRRLLCKSDCLYADGMAVVWASRILRAAVPERVNAGDFILAFLRLCADNGIRIHLIGGKDGTAERTARCWTAQIPDLRITGYESGYFKSPEHERQSIDNIGRAMPDILLVGMGVPCQEKWAAAHADEFHCGIIWNVGALFEYFGNAQPRAPLWLRNIGLEWLFRLFLEPKRLCGRYTVGNLQFVFNVLRAWRKMPKKRNIPRPQNN